MSIRTDYVSFKTKYRISFLNDRYKWYTVSNLLNIKDYVPRIVEDFCFGLTITPITHENGKSKESNPLEKCWEI